MAVFFLHCRLSIWCFIDLSFSRAKSRFNPPRPLLRSNSPLSDWILNAKSSKLKFKIWPPGWTKVRHRSSLRLGVDSMKCRSGQTAEKHANAEQEKYVQIYARTHDRFIAFERKQLQQMRRLLTILTFDQYKALTGKQRVIFFALWSIPRRVYLFRNDWIQWTCVSRSIRSIDRCVTGEQFIGERISSWYSTDKQWRRHEATCCSLSSNRNRVGRIARPGLFVSKRRGRYMFVGLS